MFNEEIILKVKKRKYFRKEVSAPWIADRYSTAPSTGLVTDSKYVGYSWVGTFKINELCGRIGLRKSLMQQIVLLVICNHERLYESRNDSA